MTALRIPPEIKDKAARRLDSLQNISTPEDVDIPGYGLHELNGTPRRWRIHVEGLFYLTFGWEGGPVGIELETGESWRTNPPIPVRS